MSKKKSTASAPSTIIGEGRVIKNTGSSYIVRLDDARELPCRIKGNFRIKGIRTTNPVAVGDNVEIAGGYITAISPRRNYIIRRASNLSKESHILAANIDQALLVVTVAHPETSLTFIDRFLATAEAYSIPAILVINKCDLLTTEPLRERAHEWEKLYSGLGYTCLLVSAQTGEGLTALQNCLKGKTTLLSGNSGVGKSTLINDLIPNADVRTAPVSLTHDTGMHTTTFSEMFELPQGGRIIDTPGVKGFGTIDFGKYEVSHYFRDIFALSKDCRYGNCLHTVEPGCAVLEALEDGRLAPSRYASYLSILEEAQEAAKYRKPQ